MNTTRYGYFEIDIKDVICSRTNSKLAGVLKTDFVITWNL